MMIRNGIKSNFRAGKRTFLFFLLILALSAVFALSVGIYSSSLSVLNENKKNFHSVIVLEYIGEQYPADTVNDPDARMVFESMDWEAISSVKGVQYVNHVNSTPAIIEGYERERTSGVYRDDIVVVVSHFLDLYDNRGTPFQYQVRMDRILYGNPNIREGVYFNFGTGSSGLRYRSGTSYLVHATMADSTRLLSGFVVSKSDLDPGVPSYMIVSGPDDPVIESSSFASIARQYYEADNYVSVHSGHDLEDLPAFQQEDLVLEEGRFPEAGESGVCVIDRHLASKMGYALGDKVSLSYRFSTEDNQYLFRNPDINKELTVVGITGGAVSYNGSVFVTDAEAVTGQPLYGYTLGYVSADDEFGIQARDRIREMVPAGVQVQLYDQGYAGASAPTMVLRSASQVIMIAAGVIVFIVLILYAFLFVGRQNETVHILKDYGLGFFRISLWFTGPMILVTSLAAAAGGYAGMYFTERVFNLVYEAASWLFVSDTRFSETAIQVTKEFSFEPSGYRTAIIYAAAGIVLCSIILCLIFLAVNLSSSRKKRGKTKVRLPKGGTSSALSGALRYAVLSIFRNGARSLIVPAVCLVLSLAMASLGIIYSRWQKSFDGLKENYPVTGEVLSLDGRYYNHLSLSAQTPWKLWKTGCLKRLSVSIESMTYKMEGDTERISPRLTAVNDLSASDLFYYDEAQIDYAPGYDESFLSEPYPNFRNVFKYGKEKLESGYYPCILSMEYARKHDIGSGDTFTVRGEYIAGYVRTSMGDNPIIESYNVPLKAAGFYKNTVNSSTILVPLGFYYNSQWLYSEEDLWEPIAGVPVNTLPEYSSESLLKKTTFQTCNFEVINASYLPALRDALGQMGFSKVNDMSTIREAAVVIRDASYTETYQNLERYLLFSRILLPVIIVLIMVIGYIVSWLLMNGRQMEFAMISGFGANPVRRFFSFMDEQFLLCLAGCLLALGILKFSGMISNLAMIMIGIFMAAYLVGTGRAISRTGRIKLVELLSERE